MKRWMMKNWMLIITILIMPVLLITGHRVRAPELNMGEVIDISSDDGVEVTFKAIEAKQIDEVQQITANLANAKGKAVAVDFLVEAKGNTVAFYYSFDYKVMNQAGKWIEPGGHLKISPLSARNDNSIVYMVGDEDTIITLYVYNAHGVVGKVVFPIIPLEEERNLEGYNVYAQLDNLSFRLPDGFTVDDTSEPFTAISPQNELMIEAWHYKGVKEKNSWVLADDVFDSMIKESEKENSSGKFSEEWNGRKWIYKIVYEDQLNRRRKYLVTIEGDNCYVVEFSMPLSTYSDDVEDTLKMICKLMFLEP